MRHIALLAVLALLGPAVRAKDVPTTVRDGTWFRVICHFGHDGAADKAFAAVEAIGPLAKDLYGLRAPREGDPVSHGDSVQHLPDLGHRSSTW